MIQVRLQSKYAIGLFPLIFLMGCSVSPPQPTSDLKCYIYERGRPSEPFVLKKGEAGWNEVLEVLKSKQGKWGLRLVSYGPRILIRADHIEWNFQNGLGLVIVNFTDGKGDPHQSVARLDDDEYGRVLKAVCGGTHPATYRAGDGMSLD